MERIDVHPMHRTPIRQATIAEYRDYQRWISSLNLKKKQKAPSENERFIRLLNKTISHPEKMLMNLPMAGKDGLQIHGCFYKRTNCLKQGFYYYGGSVQTDMFSNSTFYGLRGIGVAPPTPVTPVSPEPGQNRRINDKSYLSETILLAQATIEQFSKVRDYLNIFASRFHENKKDLRFDDPTSGLPQLSGFCERINMATEPAMVGADILSMTSYFGLKLASDFLQDPNSLITLIHEKSMPDRYSGPTYKDNTKAKVKILDGRDSIMGAYERLGRQGFRGGWCSLKNQNPTIISYEEIQEVVFELLNAMLSLSKWADAAIELLRTLVHTDAVEKSYLLAHLKSMRIQDQIDVVLRVDQSRNITEKLYQSLSDVHKMAQNIHLNLDLCQMECQNLRTAEDAATVRTPHESPPGDHQGILPLETLKFIKEFVDESMERNIDRYYYEPASFPLDEPFRSY